MGSVLSDHNKFKTVVNRGRCKISRFVSLWSGGANWVEAVCKRLSVFHGLCPGCRRHRPPVHQRDDAGAGTVKMVPASKSRGCRNEIPALFHSCS